MQTIRSILTKHSNTLLRLTPLLAFLAPIILLYALNPSDPLLHPIDPRLTFTARESFEVMWKGRTFQLFFVWLIALELILDWEKLQENKLAKLFSFRTIAFAVTLLLPTLYMITSNYYRLNSNIADFALQNNVHRWNLIPLATEYLVYAALFCAIVLLCFSVKGLKIFSVPLFFLTIVGALYAIDNVYPYGEFTPFQLLVPTTTMLAAAVLQAMGYRTDLYIANNMPHLTAIDPNTLKSATFDVAWPCAGIESLLIFTVVALLFLKRMPLSWKTKVGYFAVGAVVTYLVNVLRITAIFVIAMNGDWRPFHDLYGPLYSIAWIVAYPLIILGSQSLWRKLKKTGNDTMRSTRSQPPQPNPA
ncbi:MAG: archaeosortase/exosortase family protein [Candidatus Bathyarchaeota archaeon]|nr:archaeosortase/exosortase family protein [Candidatus Bathyarchaeota archaeon]